MLEEDFAQERRKDLGELSSVLGAGGAKVAPELKRTIDEARTCRNDGVTESGSPFRTPK